MSLYLDKEIMASNDMKPSEGILLLAISNGASKATLESLIRDGYISPSYKTDDEGFARQSGYFVTNKGQLKLADIILNSEPVIREKTTRLDALVIALQDLYPKGKKEGTNLYWRGNKPDIKRRLQAFFKKYETTYTDEQIINATKTYVESFNGDYRYMKLLQYFIHKEDIKGGVKSLVSELANYIENAGQVSTIQDLGELV